ncbi:MAG: TolC family protein [Bacteroidota bacterium]|nr:TolC family protein [Bacteroidota bacterium]
MQSHFPYAAYCLLVPVLWAQTPGKQMTITECLRRALATHPDVILARAQLAAASADLTAAFGAYLPTLNLAAGYTRQLNVEGGRSISVGGQVIRLPVVEPNTYNLSLTGSYILFDGFGREGEFQRTQATVASAEAVLAYARQRIAAEVIRQYMEVLKAERLSELRQRHHELGQQELQRLRAFVEVGRLSPVDLQAQEAEIAKREVEWLQARQHHELAVARLRSLIGMSPTESTHFADPTLSDSITPEAVRAFRQQWGSFPEALQRALQQRQDYLAAQRRVEAARATITAAHSGYFPTLAASGGWSWANSALRDFSQLGRAFIGLQLSAPLFDNFRTNARIQAAELQLQQAQVELEKLRQTIAAELQTALLTVEAIAQQMEAAQRSLRSADSYAGSMRKRLELGSITQLEYLAAESQRMTAAVTAVTLHFDFLAAQVQLRFAMGELEP